MLTLEIEDWQKVGLRMLYELRIYHCLPACLPKLLNRFRDGTLPLWEKHGIRQAGFWTVAVGPSSQDLYYMLAWDSYEERERKWSAFAQDPAWHAVRDESEKDGFLVASVENMLLSPTAFSSVK